MKKAIYLLLPLLSCSAPKAQQDSSSWESKHTKEDTTFVYFDLNQGVTKKTDTLYAVTDQEFLQFGIRVAYINGQNDTIIPFGQYAYFGTDTLTHFAQVIEYPNDSIYGKPIGISHQQKVLFDLVLFDNGPEEFHEGLLRVKRNNLMGFANAFGEIVIPCQYDYAYNFENGKAKVTYNARFEKDLDHTKVESDEWFWIDANGNKLNE